METKTNVNPVETGNGKVKANAKAPAFANGNPVNTESVNAKSEQEQPKGESATGKTETIKEEEPKAEKLALNLESTLKACGRTAPPENSPGPVIRNHQQFRSL